MSSPTKETSVDKPKQQATTAKSGTDYLDEIDKRLGLMLSQVNSLETKLIELNDKQGDDEQDPDTDVSEDVEDEEATEDGIDITELSDTENYDDFENINLELHDD